MSNEKIIVSEIREIATKYKNMVVSGEEGVGKITHTIAALEHDPNVYYIGNPVDYVGKPRPKGYDEYISYIAALKRDMRILAAEQDILGLPARLPAGGESILIIDEVFDRSEAQYDTIIELLNRQGIKTFLITGCLKNIGRLVHHIDAVLMLTKDGVLIFNKEFAAKVCAILRPEAV